VKTAIRIVSAAAFVLACAAVGRAQAPANPPAGQAAADIPGIPKMGAIVPVRVQVVIARYQGDRKVSSLPYTLTVNANDGQMGGDRRFHPSSLARLRMGADVAVPTVDPKQAAGSTMLAPVNYKWIGTSIDCSAWSSDNARFTVTLEIEDSSVYADGQTPQGLPRVSDIPSFRTYRSSNTLLLRDGQSTEFVAAADKITGEVTKVSVTMTAEK
jgi:hypothetical protein